MDNQGLVVVVQSKTEKEGLVEMVKSKTVFRIWWKMLTEKIRSCIKILIF